MSDDAAADRTLTDDTSLPDVLRALTDDDYAVIRHARDALTRACNELRENTIAEIAKTLNLPAHHIEWVWNNTQEPE